MIFPVEIMEMIADNDWRIWGVLMNTCRAFAATDISRLYRLFTLRRVKDDTVRCLNLPSGDKFYVGYRSYEHITGDTGEVVRDVVYMPGVSLRIRYPISETTHTYERSSVGSIGEYKYTLQKSHYISSRRGYGTHDIVDRAIRATRPTKSQEITEIEYDAIVAEYE